MFASFRLGQGENKAWVYKKRKKLKNEQKAIERLDSSWER